MPGFDAYVPPIFMKRLPWRFVRRRLGLDARADVGDALDEQMEGVWRKHLLECPGVDCVVLLAFDEYHCDDGTAIGPIERGRPRGSSLYVSNSLAAAWCAAHPQKLLFGASVHPYRSGALKALEEVHKAGAVLVKWLPVAQNMDPADERTEAFVRRSGELAMPLLIHYGGEVTLRRQHAEQEDPAPMLALLARLYKKGCMPPTIVAHAATPAYPWQNGAYVRSLMDAMRGPLRDAPLYADISALYYRPRWLKKFVREPDLADLRRRLVFGSDFPVVPTTFWVRRAVRHGRREIDAASSWVEKSLRIMQAMGFDESVFHRAGSVLGLA